MASSSDGSLDDPNPPPNEMDIDKSINSGTASKDSNTKEKSSVFVRFEFKVTNNNVDKYPAPSIHRNILCILEKAYPNTTVSVDNNEIISSKSNDEEFNNKFEYKILDRAKNRIVCVAHSISSNASFSDIKSAIAQPLQQNNCFIRIHKWAKEVDIVNVGWLYKSHPTVHNRNQIKNVISTACSKLNIPFVDFEIYTKGLSYVDSATNQRNKTFAIQFACPKSNAAAVKSLLKACFDDEDIYLPGKFIPSDIAVASSTDNVYEKYLKLHNKYLSTHRAIRVSGIHPSTLTSPLEGTRPSHNNLMKIVQTTPWIEWLSYTNQTERNGKIVLSTNEGTYSGALEWIDKTFLTLHKTIPNKLFPPEFEGNEAICITRGPSRPKTYDSYTQSLITDVSDLSDESYSSPPKNAWSKPLSIVATSVQKTADNSSAQPSTITVDSQISALTEMVEQMRNEVSELRKQQASIESVIENTITEKLNDIDKRYENIINKINKRWENAITKQLEKAEKDIDQTVDMVIAKRDEINKQRRSEPGSGNSRLRKQPRSISKTSLESVKTGLITKYLASDTSMDSKIKNE